MSSLLKFKHLLSCQNLLGEGPRWHPIEAQLYWVDIEKHQIHSYKPGDEEYKSYDIGIEVGCFAFRSNGGFILATENGFASWSPNEDLEFISDPEAGKRGARFNDGAVDIMGRFWAGTMTAEGKTSSLYRLDPDDLVQRMETGIWISNGIDWSPDSSQLYFTDSPLKTIFAYDFDLQAGTVSNRRPLVMTVDESGVPDGLTVDADGCLWSARWDGWRIDRYDPQGKLIEAIAMPCQRPTSCTFGGTDLSTLYITSARTGISPQDLESQPLAGDLFMIETQSQGQQENFFLG